MSKTNVGQEEHTLRPVSNLYAGNLTLHIGGLTNKDSRTSSVSLTVSFIESSPTLTGAARLTGQRYQFLLNALAGQNYTIQFSTNLSVRPHSPASFT